MEDEQKNKAHKGKTVGNKAAKKDALKKKRSGIDLEPNRGSNLKAFQGPSSGSHKGQKFLRSVEKRESALHLPTVDKTLRHIVAEPPLLVAVVGPPGVGKSTLIRSMVKFYSNRNLQSVRGPITVVAGKTRRLTFIECPNTLSAMCDVAKTADLILLMVDGNFGFEMETFEFLNIAQVHGFPKMFGIVSHLDQLKTGKALKKRKKFLRHRFWHEVAAGAKIMCLAPMIHSLYRPTDVLNLHRLLICVEPKIQAWRNTHSCILMDRHEDITNPDVVAADSNCNRSIAFYGYARGRPIKTGQLVHIPGLGDFPIHHLSHQDDPCQVDGFGDLKSQGHRMRHLSMKQKKLYAPYCDVGGITYDDDAIYVQQDAEMGAIQRSGEGVELLHELQRAEPMDVSAARLEVMRRPVVFRHEDTMELEMDEVRAPSNSSSEEDDDEDYDDEPARAGQPSLADFGEREESGEEDANEDDDGTLAPRLRNAADSIRLSVPHHAWMDGEEANMSLVRMLKDLCVTGKWAEDGDAPDAEEDGEAVDENSKGYESDDEDFEAEARGTKPLSCHSDGAEEGPSPSDDDDDDDESNDGERADATVARRHDALAGLSHSGSRSGGDASSWSAFMAPGGSSSSAARRTRTAKDDEDDDYNILDDDEDEDGEGGEVSGAPRRAADEDEELNDLVSGFLNNTTEGSGKTKEEDAIRFYDPNARRQAAVDDGDEVEEAVANQDTLTEEQEKLLQRKMAKKAAFDEDYDAGTGKSMTYSHLNKLNRKAQEVKERIDDALRDVGEEVEQKIQLVGYFSGLYIRFVVQDVPVEFVRCFNPCTPLIAGGVNPGEDEYTIVHAKIKRHRWYPKVLKAQDPLLLSIGWRRIQTQPIFATDDPNGRCRYLKYSPLHMHCNAAFYAPVAPANTGFLAIPVRDQRTTNFRISCTGYTVGNDVTTDIVKKLKLTGTPAKIEKTTVFVKGMFNSDVEAAKFVGAKLKSVAGIRGIIKSVLKGKQGLVRATFEDKILPSDIVFIRAWKGVQPPKYCAMQRNLVDPEWVGMRTMRELRIDYGVPLPQNADSEYREIKRRHRGDEDAAASKKVLISRNMRMQLPFDMKEEYIPVARTSAMQERIQGAVTIVPERREQRRRALLDTFEDRADAMTRKKDEAKKRARVRAASEAAKENEVYLQGLKKAKKETARRAEFRSQHKSRSHGKSASSS